MILSVYMQISQHLKETVLLFVALKLVFKLLLPKNISKKYDEYLCNNFYTSI
jgi:hypothetical protein